eukprot:gb/GEZN01006983.1/.p1 GENE.gb/GEZN01006983.1/~~gb/GEZN01006983.1/.p1  ORF type:complete len:488 (-),score=33.12 gb/GEZN01006983.1/:26-1489(-)
MRLLLGVLYSLHGIPSSIIDGFLPQVLKANDINLAYVGLAYLLYLPYNFRFLFALGLDRFGGANVAPLLLSVLLSCISLLFFCCSFYTVSVFSEDRAVTLAHLQPVYFLLALIELALALSDPALDALLISAHDDSSSASNALQMVACKAGKWAAGLACTVLLSTLQVGWNVLLLGIAAIYSIGAFVVYYVFRRRQRTGSPPRSLSTGATHKRSVGDLIWRCACALGSRLGLWLFLLALTNKLGEVVTRQMLTPFLMDETMRAIDIAPVLLPHARQAAVTQQVAALVNEASFVSLIGSVLPLSAATTHVKTDRVMLYAMLSTAIVRFSVLIAMSILTNQVPLAFVVFSHPAADPSFIVAPQWRLVLDLFALSSGLSTSLSYVVLMVGVRALAASDPRVPAVFISVYSVLECTDDWGRTIGTTLSGYILLALASQFVRLFAISAALSLVPLIANIALCANIRDSYKAFDTAKTIADITLFASSEREKIQ